VHLVKEPMRLSFVSRTWTPGLQITVNDDGKVPHDFTQNLDTASTTECTIRSRNDMGSTRVCTILR
jgi:hypothetical protein